MNNFQNLSQVEWTAKRLIRQMKPNCPRLYGDPWRPIESSELRLTVAGLNDKLGSAR